MTPYLHFRKLEKIISEKYKDLRTNVKTFYDSEKLQKQLFVDKSLVEAFI